jgi:hypothetical protein
MTTDNLQNAKQAKKQLFVLVAGKASPLSFNAVMVYSFLVYRFNVAKGSQHTGSVTRQQIHRGTGLSATRTIPAAIIELQQHGLIGLHGDRLFPWQPKQDDWFVGMKNPGMRPWYARIAYFPVWIPVSARGSGLVPRTNALYFLIRHREGQKKRYYALKLGVCEATVRSGIRTLRRLGLVSRYSIVAVEPNDEQLGLWQDRKTKKLKQWRLSETDRFQAVLGALDGSFTYYIDYALGGRAVSARQAFVEDVDQFGRKMQAAGYSTKEIDDYWQETAELCGIAAKLELFIWGNFSTAFDYAQQQTRLNAAAGTFSGTNSLGLLKRLTRQALAEIDTAWENYAAYGLGRCTHQWTPRGN